MVTHIDSDPTIQLLIVDDEEAQKTALCSTLAAAGYSSRGFSSGEQALAAMREQRFELALTDLSMPAMGGIEFLRAAQQIDPDIVGVVMTGHGAIGTAIDAMKAGALDYILKPFSRKDILPVLARALDIRRLRTENARLQRSVFTHVADLESANLELEAFSHSVSHDLRAPLQAVGRLAGILTSNYGAGLPVEAQGLLRGISAGTARMSQLVEDLLRFSQVNHQVLAKAMVEMSGLVQAVLSEIGPEAVRGIEVEVQELPTAFGDAALLKQVYLNLLSNAMKFTRSRDPAIVTVGCERTAERDVFFVRDNGAGFDMQHADKLFGVFQRLHSAREFEGTGIGLSLTRRIVERHGGRIWAHAQVDQGATFSFTLAGELAGSGQARLL